MCLQCNIYNNKIEISFLEKNDPLSKNQFEFRPSLCIKNDLYSMTKFDQNKKLDKVKK